MQRQPGGPGEMRRLESRQELRSPSGEPSLLAHALAAVPGDGKKKHFEHGR